MTMAPQLPRDATTGTVEAGDTALAYATAGEGRPIVLVGGWPQSLHCWRKVFEPLARDYKVIAIDPPGLGDSAKPAPAYNIVAVAQTIGAAIDRFGLQSFDFIGFDIGMWIGYPLALQRPQQVRTLTLIDARIPGLVPFPPFNPRGALVSWHFAFNMLPELPEILIEGREREFLAWLFKSRTPTPGVFSEADVDEYARVYRGKTAIASALGYYRALPETIAEVEQLKQGPKLAMPVLTIAGEHGVGATMADALKSVSDKTRGVVVENCGHYVPEEAPDRLLKELLELLS
jgi:pimeloyl-ACP methyl ester carboxylesterase